MCPVGPELFHADSQRKTKVQSLSEILQKNLKMNGAWGGVVVKALRYSSEGPGNDPGSLGIFSGTSDSSMCPGIDSASKNEYQDIPGGKDGRCVKVTTLPPSYTRTPKATRPVVGLLYLYLKINFVLQNIELLIVNLLAPEFYI